MTVTDPRTSTPAKVTPIGPNGEEVTSKVPFHMKDSLHVPAERYYSREFYDLEKEKLWSHVWQMACREEEIPDPGDFVEYEIVGKSFLLVRQNDGSVKALHNACRHRGTQLGKGSGRFPGGQIVCPFHGWRWKTDGQCSHVFGREGFSDGVLSRDEIDLPECLVDTWGGHVWINMDRDAGPLREALFPVADILDHVNVGNMRVKWWKEVVLNCNWKLAQEAFFESYHVKQTHPQLYTQHNQDDADETNRSLPEYQSFVNGHGLFQGGDAQRGSTHGNATNVLEMARVLWSGQDAMTLERDLWVMESVSGKVDPTDPQFGLATVDALFEYWESAGIPAYERRPEALRLWGGDVFMFPNYLMLPMYNNCLCYRVTPHNDDPEQCKFEVWSLTAYPEGNEPGRPESLGRFDKDDADHWGLIPRQDFSNIERMQQGIKAPSFTETRLAAKWELTISNMHEELDRRLAAEY
ncbi:(2Fe-2S)-binding protein [Acrocarpospora pleiomorpha]|uniref:(2Fe-2S)-binding protein n=1 Tax=Acrocarpospora pleiomorpha TaxID=90975 RepID=A0A5M3XB65_9ACTN|nr:aromatic ring-hydroxylating dioxygenase subunit alpha [Acrocarpospora pleiomorpha]GES18404.1 (2Fe-2S)-binding protein [Acrocarpospora pleiomorpha]